MINTSSFWGFKASRNTSQPTLIPGSSKWVCNEMNEANSLILQSTKYFSTLVSSELIWLNEQMAEVIEAKDTDPVDSLLLLKSPAKLSSKDSPVRKVRQQAIQEMNRPPQPILVPKKSNGVPKSEVSTTTTTTNTTANTTANTNSRPIPQLVPLNDKLEPVAAANKPKSPLLISSRAASAEVSLLLRSAEKLGSLDLPGDADSGEYDASFEAISRTIKPKKTVAGAELATTRIALPSKSTETAKSTSTATETAKSTSTSTATATATATAKPISAPSTADNISLPSTTPLADRLSLFASLPSKEPLTVKSSKKENDSTTSKQVMSTDSTSSKVPSTTSKLYPAIYAPINKNRPLAKSLLEDHKDEDSPFKVSKSASASASASKDWIPPSPNKRSGLIRNEKSSKTVKSVNVKQKSQSTTKESPLNSIFANALKRAYNLISPDRAEGTKKALVSSSGSAGSANIGNGQSLDTTTNAATSTAATTTRSVKRIVNSKSSRGNLMERLTADTESSAARSLKLQPTTSLYPEIESPLSKRFNKSPLSKKNHTLKSTESSNIPKLPVFKRTEAITSGASAGNGVVSGPDSANRKSPPKSQPKRKLTLFSPEKIITKDELSKVNGNTISLTTSELQRKRQKLQESLTNLPLGSKSTLPNRKSASSSHRINKRMAEERLKVEEMRRRQRLSSSQIKVVSLDEQLKLPLHRMREKSLKATETIVEGRTSSVLATLSDELMNKRRKTEEKLGKLLKSSGVLPNTTTAPTSTAVRSQTLMRTAMLQHSRLNKSGVSAGAAGGAAGGANVNSTDITPSSKLVRKSTTPSKSPTILPDIFSEPEDDEDGHILKDWAESPELKKLLLKQQNINPDQVFGAIAPLNMDEIFRASRTAKFRARSSSAHWGTHDLLSAKEADDYSKKMGWKNK